MKKTIITPTLIAALSATATTAFAAEIPRETTPLNATEQQIQITENLISDILDEVQAGRQTRLYISRRICEHKN